MAVSVQSIVIARNPAYPQHGREVMFTADYLSSTVTFTFSEPIQDGSFILADVQDRSPSGRSLSNLTKVSGTVYTATLTAWPNRGDAKGAATGSRGLYVYHRDVNDAQGNPGSAPDGGGDFVQSGRYFLGTRRIAITSIELADTNLTAGETTTVTFTFNKSVGGNFDAGDIDLSQANCTLVPGSLRRIPSSDNDTHDHRFWTATLRANDDVQNATGNVIRVHQTGVHDIYSVSGQGDSTPSAAYTVDTVRPVLDTAANGITVSGDQLVLRYDQALDAAHKPDKANFRVSVNGVLVSNAVAEVNVAGQAVTLRLTTPVTSRQVVTVSYNDPTTGNDANAIQDAAGNDAVSFTDKTARNDTPADTTPPVLITTGADAPQVSGNQLVLTYADTSDLGAGAAAPPATAFTVRVDGVLDSVAAVSVTGKTVTLRLTTAVAHGQKVTVSYADPSAGDDPSAIQDTAGNDAATFADQQVTNNTVDPPHPPDAPSTPVAPRPDRDNDSVPDAQEDQAPGITGPGGAAPVAGDGNGDGIKDSQQSKVGSMNGMTLVISSQDGKPTSTDASVRIVSMEQKAAPANLPKGLEMPIGLLSFETQLAAAGSPGSFSLYVDPAQGINGYWVQDRTGVWMNLASVPYGGKMVPEGGRLRLDFKITDGGPFDTDGKADGVVTAAGAAGYMQLSIVGQTHGMEHLGFWF